MASLKSTLAKKSTVRESSAYLTPVDVKGEFLQDDWNKML